MCVTLSQCHAAAANLALQLALAPPASRRCLRSCGRTSCTGELKGVDSSAAAPEIPSHGALQQRSHLMHGCRPGTAQNPLAMQAIVTAELLQAAMQTSRPQGLHKPPVSFESRCEKEQA